MRRPFQLSSACRAGAELGNYFSKVKCFLNIKELKLGWGMTSHYLSGSIVHGYSAGCGEMYRDSKYSLVIILVAKTVSYVYLKFVADKDDYDLSLGHPVNILMSTKTIVDCRYWLVLLEYNSFSGPVSCSDLLCETSLKLVSF